MNESVIWFGVGTALWIGLSCFVSYFLGHTVGVDKGRGWGMSETYAVMTFQFYKIMAKERNVINATNDAYYQKEFYDGGMVFSNEYLELNPPMEDR